MLIANKAFSYAGRSLRAGDEFEPKSRSDVEILTKLDKARHAPLKQESAPSIAVPKTYKRRDMRAEKAPVVYEEVSVPTSDEATPVVETQPEPSQASEI